MHALHNIKVFINQILKAFYHFIVSATFTRATKWSPPSRKERSSSIQADQRKRVVIYIFFYCRLK